MSSASRESLPLHLYGKLPIAKDYLRVGCGDGAARELREWLDQGFSTAPPGGAAPTLAFPMRFLAGDAWSGRASGAGVLTKWLGRIGGDASALVGCMWPSSDAGGLRPFPLALLLERDRRVVARELELGLEETATWWTALENEQRWVAAHAESEALLLAARQRRVAPAAPDVASAAFNTAHTASGSASTDSDSAKAEAPTFDDWTAALWPNDSHAGLHEALETIATCVREQPDAPLRLPLVNDLPFVTQAHAWWRVWSIIRRSPHAPLPTLFFPCSGGSADIAAFLVIYPSKPRPSDVVWLTPASASTRVIGCDLSRESAVVRDASARGARAPALPIEAGVRAALAELGR